jgi:hypothetical protein
MSIKSTFNPQSYANGYVSMNRNIFILSSLAVASIGLSKNKQKLDGSIKFIVILILLYNCLYGYSSTRDFEKYIKYIESKHDLPDLYQFQLNQWKRWTRMGHLYIGILLVFICIVLFKF